MALLSGAMPEANFMMECISEPLAVPFGPDATPGPPPHTELHAGDMRKRSIHSSNIVEDVG